MILLIGPGGAGKTTIGTALAERLGTRLVDLDAVFRSRHGDISAYIDDSGYAAYAKQNVDLFANLVVGRDRPDIVALSSGFMTYAPDVDPSYPFWREWVAASPLTFVLLPSLQLEVCIREIVRRQLGRPFARSAEREEQVIRARFPIYAGLRARKVETMQAVETVAAGMISLLAAESAAARGTEHVTSRPG